MTEQQVKKGEEIVEENVAVQRKPHEPLLINQADYLNKARKVAPQIARKHCQLDQIEAALKDAGTVAVDIVEDEKGELVEVPIDPLTETEEALLGVCSTLAQMLREEWTYP